MVLEMILFHEYGGVCAHRQEQSRRGDISEALQKLELQCPIAGKVRGVKKYRQFLFCAKGQQ